MKSRDLKILYPFGSDIANSIIEENPEIFFHSSSYGRQIYLKKLFKKYQVCTYHFYRETLPKNIIHDDDYLISHRDDIVPIYETINFLDAQEKFFECTYRLLIDDQVLSRCASTSRMHDKVDGKGFFYI